MTVATMVVRNRRRLLRAAATCAGGAVVIAVVFVLPPTIVNTANDLRYARSAAVSGGIDPAVSLRDIAGALQATGEISLAGPWAVSAGRGDQAGPVLRVLRTPTVITDDAGTPMVEIVSATGTLLYRSPGVPVEPGHTGPVTPDMVSNAREDAMGPTGSFGLWAGPTVAGSGGPDTAVCDQFDTTHWRFGHGVLTGVEQSAADQVPARICLFRTAEQVQDARLDIVKSSLVRSGESFVGYWAMALPVVAVGGLVVSRFRRRVRAASRADTPVLVDNPRPHSLLGGITDDVNHSLTRARMSVEQQRSFVADAAHELRSPLTSLITTLEVADRHPGIVDPQQVTRTSLAQARRLERLTQDLLLLAQVDARARLREDVVDLADVIREVVADTPEQGRPVRVAGVTAIEVIGDREAFRRVLRNLVDNAVRHAVTTVDVTLSVGDGRALVEVANDGVAIPDDRAEQIFDRFTRLDDARARDAGGSGLGLAIARGVTERYGGTVTLLPGRRDGATFVWELPVAR